MPVTKKKKKKKKKERKKDRKIEQTTDVYDKERKTKPQMLMANKNVCPNQASKQLTPNETKQLKPPQKCKRWPTCKHKVEKNTTKSQQSNRLLSATNEWTTALTTFVAAIRAQSKTNCADKQMESQTNHN